MNHGFDGGHGSHGPRRSHGSHGSHRSRGSHGSHGLHGSLGGHGSRGSRGSHGSHGSHESFRGHGSHGFHGSQFGVPHGAWAVLVFGIVWLIPALASAQAPTGHLSILFDHFPTQHVTELRARAFVEEKVEATDDVRVRASGFIEGLAADRGGRVTDVIAEPQELSVDVRVRRVDVTAGVA